jgi:hypothetical protein
MKPLYLQLRALLGPPPQLAVTLLCPLMFWALALYLIYQRGCGAAAGLATGLCAMGAFFVAFNVALLYPARLSELRELCLPGRVPYPRALAPAAAALGVVFVLAPAAALAAMSHSAQPAEVVCFALLGGLFMARAPLIGAALCAVVVLATQLKLAHLHPALAVIDLETVLAYPRLALPVMYLLLLALLSWCWYPILSGDPAALEAAAQRARRMSWAARSIKAGRSTHPLEFAADRRGLSPVEVVRTCLGPTYMPASIGRRSLRYLYEVGLTALPLAVTLSRSRGWHFGWRVTLLLLIVALWFNCDMRVAAVLHSASGEVAELALLPGLGQRRAQLRTLLRAALGTPLAVTAGIVILGIFALMAEQRPLAASLTTLLWVACACLLAIASMLIVLARRPRPGLWVELLLMAALCAALVWWMGGDAAGAVPSLREFLVPVLAVLLLAGELQRLSALPRPLAGP